MSKPVLSWSGCAAVVALLLLVSLGAQGQKIHVNTFDPKADFAAFKSYGWTPMGAVSHPMLAADVVAAIEAQMKQRGLLLTANNPDLIIKVYGSIDQDSTFYSNDPLYGVT